MTRPRPSSARLLAGGLVALLTAGLLGAAPAAAAEPTQYARDNFFRTTTSGLGTAELGGTWSTPGGGFKIDRYAAVATLSPDAERLASLDAVSTTEVNAKVEVTLPRPSAGSIEAAVIGRRVNGNAYRTALVIPASGVPVVELRRNDVVLASATLERLNFISGTERLHLRIEAVGTSPTLLKAKVWIAGRVEPAEWTATAADSTAALQAPGAVGIAARQSSTAAPAPLEARFRAFSAVSTVAPPPPPAVNKAPRASFTMAQNGRTVTFDASASTDPDGSIRSYEWEFGDGSKGTGKIVTHTYAGEGQWGIKLTITDDDGAFGRATNGVRYFESALVGRTIVSVHNLFTGGPANEQFFGTGAEVLYGFAPTLTRGIEFFVTKPGTDTTLRIDVSPPSGQPLRPGRYRQIEGDITDTVPDLDISYSSSAMDFDGDLDIRELSADSTGKIISFDIVFGGSDLQWASPIWGQLRANQPESSRYTLATRAISFHSSPVAAARSFATQWVKNTSSTGLPIGRAALTAGSTADYAIADDRCSGTVLAAGARCSIRVGFSPKAAGPRNATLSLPIDGVTQPIELNGWAPPGASSIAITSEVLDQPPGSAFANGPYLVLARKVPRSTSFVAFSRSDGSAASVSIRHGQAQSLTLGRHVVSDDYMDPDRHWLSVTAEGLGCNPLPGSSYTVNKYREDAAGTPVLADISFTAYCSGSNGEASTGRVLYNARTDITAPARASGLRVSGTGSSRSAGWTKSTSADLSYTVARLVPGVPTGANGTNGYAVYSGTGTSARLPAMKKGQRYTLLVFSVDQTGNISSPATLAVTG